MFLLDKKGNKKFHRAKRELDNKGNILKLEFFGADGNYFEAPQEKLGMNCAVVKQRFNDKNEVIEQACYDKKLELAR